MLHDQVQFVMLEASRLNQLLRFSSQHRIPRSVTVVRPMRYKTLLLQPRFVGLDGGVHVVEHEISLGDTHDMILL